MGETEPKQPSLSLNEAFCTRNGFHIIKLLDRHFIWGSTNNTGCLQRLQFEFHKLTTRPHCQHQHLHNSLVMGKLNWGLHRAIMLVSRKKTVLLITSNHILFAIQSFTPCYIRTSKICSLSIWQPRSFLQGSLINTCFFY